MTSLDELAFRLAKENFHIALLEHHFPPYRDIAPRLIAAGYTHFTTIESSSPFTQKEKAALLYYNSRQRQRLYAQRLAPLVRSLLSQDYHVFIINYPPKHDEGNGLAAALLTLFPQYSHSPRSLISPFTAPDSPSALSAVRLAHGLSFYCSDIAAFLEQFQTVYPEDSSVRELYYTSLRVISETSCDINYKRKQLRDVLQKMSRELSAVEDPATACTQSDVLPELTYRIDGLYSLLYGQSLLFRNIS